MVWGRISFAGVGPIVRFVGYINASLYKELLHQHALPHFRKGAVENPVFIDNAPCHKAKTVLSFLEEEGIAVMKWPPLSQRYKSYRECMENHWRESLEQKSSKY